MIVRRNPPAVAASVTVAVRVIDGRVTEESVA